MVWQWYLLASVVVSAYFLAVALANVVYLRSATLKARVTQGPSVSVIVPARNEELSIVRCLDSLLAQDYADYEVIVVDDLSEDATAEAVVALLPRFPRLKLVRGGPLPAGWLGKPYALEQGVAAARGDVLVFTDADTVHEPSSISWAVTNLEAHGADMLSGYLRQQYGSMGESLIVPTMYAMMLLTPLFLLPRTRSPQLAFAIGQYVAVRREALEAVGGFAPISDSIVDDMSLARRVKEFGFRGVFLDAKCAASCRLYSGYRDAFEGIERSVYSALGASPLAVAAVAAVALGFIVAPPLVVLESAVRMQMPPWEMTAAALLFAGQWALVSADRDVPFIAFALYPFVFVSLLAILGASMLSTGFGRGAEWKGRLVRVPRHRRLLRGRPGPVGRPRPGTRA